MSELGDLRDSVEQQRQLIAALTARLDTLAPIGSPPAAVEPPTSEPPTSEPPTSEPRRFSRRGLLAAAVAGGAGLVATQVTTAAPAAAAPGNAVVLGADNNGATSITAVTSDPGLNSSPFAVVNPNSGGQGVGLYARLGARTERFDGSGNQRAAVVGDSRGNSGVTGLSVNGIGVFGSSDVTGVEGAGGLFGVTGRSTSADGAGVYGVNSAGFGVYANSSSGTGLSASSSAGYGVVADGALAPLRLVPAATRGAPRNGRHLIGELYVDKVGVLFSCTRSGTPGTWKAVTLG